MRTPEEMQQELLAECPNGYILQNGYARTTRYCHDHNMPLRDFIRFLLTDTTYWVATNNVIINHIVNYNDTKCRSLEDLFLIAHNYYPFVTIKEIIDVLYNKKEKDIILYYGIKQ